VRALHSDNGTIVADLDTDTSGNREASVESVQQPFGWTAREYDRTTGLYHLRNRDYDPNTGRFMQEDPVWLNAGDHNVYRYTWNNPVKYTDPSGLSVGIEYGCLSDFGMGAGTSAGATGGTGVGTVLFGIAGALGAQQAPQLAQFKQTSLKLIASQVAQGGGQCRAVKEPSPPTSCPLTKRGGTNKPKTSFAAGTLVLTQTGLRPIEDIQVGEMVASRVAASGETRWQPVRARMIREAPQVMRLTVKDEVGRLETVVVTPNHPYLRADGTIDILRAVSLDPGGLWTAAGYLKAGDKLESASGKPLEVVRVEVDSAPTQVYNFEVAEDHTYAVGELQAWVHNAKNTGRYREKSGGWPQAERVFDRIVDPATLRNCGDVKIGRTRDGKTVNLHTSKTLHTRGSPTIEVRDAAGKVTTKHRY
jgi:RHS repeat-associated protein